MSYNISGYIYDKGKPNFPLNHPTQISIYRGASTLEVWFGKNPKILIAKVKPICSILCIIFIDFSRTAIGHTILHVR